MAGFIVYIILIQYTDYYLYKGENFFDFWAKAGFTNIYSITPLIQLQMVKVGPRHYYGDPLVLLFYITHGNIFER